jgi:hypothetical protein
LKNVYMTKWNIQPWVNRSLHRSLQTKKKKKKLLFKEKIAIVVIVADDTALWN